MNNPENKNNLKERLKTNSKLIEVFVGIGAGVLLWVLMISALNLGKATTFLIINFIIILVSVIVSVKLLKKGYKILGTILLVFLVPAILLLLLIGACTGFTGGL